MLTPLTVPWPPALALCRAIVGLGQGIAPTGAPPAGNSSSATLLTALLSSGSARRGQARPAAAPDPVRSVFAQR